MAVTNAPATRARAAVMLGAAIAVGSVAFTLIKVVLRDVSPLTLAAGRVVFSALTFVAVVTAQPARRRPIERADRWRVLACGLGGSAGFHVLFSWGQREVSVAVAAIVLGTMPALVALGEVVVLRHRFGGRTLAGLALSLVGIAAISWRPDSGGHTSVPGLLAVAGATAVWAAVTVLTRSLGGRYDAWWLNTPGTVLGALVMIALAAPRAHELRALPLSSWVWLVWLGSVSSAFVYAAMAYAVSVLPATTTASLSTLVTPLSVVVAWVHLGERPDRPTVVGVLAVAAGVALVSTGAATERSSPT